MKRHVVVLSVLFALMLSMSTGAQTDGNEPWEMAFSFSEADVDTLPDGLHVWRGAPTVQIEPDHQRPALRIRPRVGSAAGTWDAAFVMFPAVTDRVIVEFSAYTPDKYRSLAANVGYREGPTVEGEYGAYITVHDAGRLTYYVDGAGWFDLGTTDVSQWNRYKMDVDLTSQTFAVYVNDMDTPIGTGIMRLPQETLTELEFSTWGNDTRVPMWVNDIRIYTVD